MAEAQSLHLLFCKSFPEGTGENKKQNRDEKNFSCVHVYAGVYDFGLCTKRADGNGLSEKREYHQREGNRDGSRQGD